LAKCGVKRRNRDGLGGIALQANSAHLSPFTGRGRSLLAMRSIVQRDRVRGTFRRPCSWKIPLTPTLSPQAGRGSSRLACQTSTSSHTRLLIPAARCARVVHLSFAHRGRGECRMPKRTRSLAWENKNHTSVVTAGTRRFTRHSRTRMVLTVSFALSLVTGLFCHHRRRDAKHHRQLDASVGASGPHDFAVREPHPSSSVATASTASRAQRP
jgi:hypothetical protein